MWLLTTRCKMGILLWQKMCRFRADLLDDISGATARALQLQQKFLHINILISRSKNTQILNNSFFEKSKTRDFIVGVQKEIDWSSALSIFTSANSPTIKWLISSSFAPSAAVRTLVFGKKVHLMNCVLSKIRTGSMDCGSAVHLGNFVL